MAGAGGLEPPSAGTKTLCLTAWRRPKIPNGIISHVVPAFKQFLNRRQVLLEVDEFNVRIKDRIREKQLQVFALITKAQRLLGRFCRIGIVEKTEHCWAASAHQRTDCT
jgi:hypothetical protein